MGFDWIAVAGALVAVIPVLVKMWANRVEVRHEKAEALHTHSLHELHAGRDRVRNLQQAPPPVQPNRSPTEL